jgi:Fe-S cluster assembly iron-binding protein IscA
MALDEPREDDEVFAESGITYVVNKQLFARVKPIQIDFVKTERTSGYRISANLTKANGSCSC